jgi:hypothetical protein
MQMFQQRVLRDTNLALGELNHALKLKLRVQGDTAHGLLLNTKNAEQMVQAWRKKISR